MRQAQHAHCESNAREAVQQQRRVEVHSIKYRQGETEPRDARGKHRAFRLSEIVWEQQWPDMNKAQCRH